MSPGEPWLGRDERKPTLGVRVSVMVVVAVLLAAGLLWVLGAEQRAILSMEPERRAVVFQQSYASFEAMCHEDPGGFLTANCRRQARFLQKFPECQGVCRTETLQYIGEAMR